MFKPLVIGSRMELVSKKSLRNNEERIVYASQILDFNDDSIVCAMPYYLPVGRHQGREYW